jgi:uncharacterized damage-inducible protein DinB
MATDISDLIDGVRESRRYFLKFLDGLREDQWDWKPYPECKSIRETLRHLVSDDRATIAVFKTGDWQEAVTIEVTEQDVPKLLDMLEESHEELCNFLSDHFAETPLDARVPFFFGESKLTNAIMGIIGEDNYHAGQVGFIRSATDPQWGYYRAIYGVEPS